MAALVRLHLPERIYRTFGSGLVRQPVACRAMTACIRTAGRRLVLQRAVRWIAPIAALCLGTFSPAQQGKELANAKLSVEQSQQLKTDLDAFGRATKSAQRGQLFERLVGLGSAGAQAVLRLVDTRLDTSRDEYTVALQQWLPEAYQQRLIDLDYEQVLTVQRARRLWQSYVLHGGHRSSFQDEFLAPMQAAAELLLLPVEEAAEPELRARRAELVEHGRYRDRAREVLGIDPDPTVGKLSPTKIPYPSLDQSPTFLDSLHHTERSLVLAHTVAPPGAQAILLCNDEAARQIDVQEAEYVMFGNEMRLLAGTIAWQVDPLGNAVARDHSEDRTKGLAKGHMSSIPEKRGFTYRSRRFGAARFGSEGVGGGSNGRGYLRGLSYGGGHTGPLYSLNRNVVGVGRRGSAYTSIYRTDRAIMHGCQALAGELALPPGWQRSALRGTARGIFNKLHAGQFARAYKLIEKARTKNDETAMLLRFLRAAVAVEVDWLLDSAEAIEAAGDVYEAHRRLVAGRKMLRGIVRFDVFAEAEITRLETEEFAQRLRAGEAFHQIALGESDEAARQRAVRLFGKRYAGTAYAAASKELGGKNGPYHYFITKRPDVEKYDYPPPADSK